MKKGRIKINKFIFYTIFFWVFVGLFVGLLLGTSAYYYSQFGDFSFTNFQGPVPVWQMSPGLKNYVVTFELINSIFLGIFFALVVAFFLILVMVKGISNFFWIMLPLFFLFINSIFTFDSYIVVSLVIKNVNSKVFGSLTVPTMGLFFFFRALYLKKQGIIDATNVHMIAIGSVFFVASILNFIYYFADVDLRAYYWILVCSVGLYLVIMTNLKAASQQRPLTWRTQVTNSLCFVLILYEIAYSSDLMHFAPLGIEEIVFFFIFLNAEGLLFMRLKELYTNARAETQLEEDNISLERDILNEQIKPHYIFNTLFIIQSIYHKSQEKGDAAIELYKNDLISSFKNTDKPLIPFKDELGVIENFIKMQNILKDVPFKIKEDLEYVDFMIPPLSIEPLIENSVRYSNCNLKEDGMILIKTHKEGDKIIIEVSDNGNGFDIKQVRADSIGVKNLTVRFTKFLNGTVEIHSTKGIGTWAKITIPE